MAKKKLSATFSNVQFKGMTANHEKSRCSIGVKLNVGDDPQWEKLDTILTGSRLQCDMTVRPKEDIDDDSGSQQTMDESVMELTAIGDCKGFTRRPGQIAISLVFNDADVDPATINALTGRAGKLKLSRLGDMSVEEEE